ncbi:Subtilisin-like protease 2, partial [Colletotrichum shisoi]
MTPLRFLALLVTLISACLSQELSEPPAVSARTFQTKYSIWAKKGLAKEDADGFYNTLVGMVGDKDKIESIFDENNIPYAWRAALTAAQIDKVDADRVVDRVDVDKRLTLAKPGSAATADIKKRAVTKQVPTKGNTNVDLRTLSTPPGDPLAKSYGYDDTAGKGITIYLIDTGPFGSAHSELQPPDSSVTRENINVMNHPYVFDETSNHGTCVASKAVGKTVGVAKRANLITVRVDVTPGEYDIIRIWQTVYNDIKRKGLRGKAVVSVSTEGYPTTDAEVNKRILLKMIELTDSIMLGMDVPIICSAGNRAARIGGSMEPDSLPAVLAKNKTLPIIVVGAATTDGTMLRFSQRGGLLTTWAVAEDVECADFNALDGILYATGTSVAAPQIAGLAAYFMSNPNFKDKLRPGSIAKDMRALIGSYSYPRGSTDDHPNIAWNGFDPKSSLPAQPPGTRTATADPQCNVCGQLNKKVMRYEAGCPGVEYARWFCKVYSDCQ